MRLEPTERARHLSRAGLALAALGLALVEFRIVALGAALLVAVGASRAWARLSVARARAAGFEMSWLGSERSFAVTRLRTTTLALELSNRDRQPLYFNELEVTHAPGLEISVEPRAGEIRAGSSLRVEIRVRALRVGYHGVFGLILRAVQAPGLFEVPLGFSSPLVFDVLPISKGRRLRLPRTMARDGHADGERRSAQRGDGSEMRELRELLPGDSFRRIAWKASARRGRLLVLETEREHRESAWFLVDACLESAGGNPGEAALDRTIDRVAQMIDRHLERGDRIGLCLVGTRELVRIPLGRGPAQMARIIDALSHHTHCADAERSEWDAADVRRRVFEHLRSLDSRAMGIDPENDAELVPLVQKVLDRAPLRAAAPRAESAEQRLFRQYLLSFGVQPPPLGAFDRARAERALARALHASCAPKPRPSLVYVFSRAPAFDTPREWLAALAEARRFRVAVEFHATEQLGELPANARPRLRLVHDALHARLATSERWAERELSLRGVAFVSARRG